MRVTGHKLLMEWSGEYGEESSSTGTCICGAWEEAASSQRVVREEYRYHLSQKTNERNTLWQRLR